MSDLRALAERAEQLYGMVRELRDAVWAFTAQELAARGDPAEAPTQGDSERVRTIAELEREELTKAIRLAGGSVEKAADMIGMSRATAYRRLMTYRKEI